VAPAAGQVAGPAAGQVAGPAAGPARSNGTEQAIPEIDVLSVLTHLPEGVDPLPDSGLPVPDLSDLPDLADLPELPDLADLPDEAAP
jgi:hypothetical protein